MKISKRATTAGKIQYYLGNIFFYSLVISLCFSILFPLIKMIPEVFNSLEDVGNPNVVWVPEEFSIASFLGAKELVYGDFMNLLKTLLYAAIITVVNISTSIMAGYALGRVKFKGGSIIMGLIVMVLVVPPQSLLIAQYLNFKQFDIFGIITLLTGSTINLVDKPITLYLLALFGFGVKQSLFIFIFRQFFKALPVELEEAAYLDGCGFFRTFYKIGIPNAVPSIITVGTLAFVWNYGDTYYTMYFHANGPYVANKLTTVFTGTDMHSIDW